MRRQQEVHLAGLILLQRPQGSNVVVDGDVGVAQAAAGAIGDDARERAVVDLQVGLHAGRFLQLAIELGSGELALFEGHVVERRLRAFEHAERPGGVGLVAWAWERVVQPAAEVFLRKHEVEHAVAARQHGHVFVRIGCRAIADVDRAHHHDACHRRVRLGTLAGDDESEQSRAEREAHDREQPPTDHAASAENEQGRAETHAVDPDQPPEPVERRLGMGGVVGHRQSRRAAAPTQVGAH